MRFGMVAIAGLVALLVCALGLRDDSRRGVEGVVSSSHLGMVEGEIREEMAVAEPSQQDSAQLSERVADGGDLGVGREDASLDRADALAFSTFRVVDDVTGRAIEGALVSMRDEAGARSIWVTDADGVASVRRSPRDRRFVVTCVGYWERVGYLWIDTAEQAVRLKREAFGSTIEGIVTTEEGKPVGGVVVVALVSSESADVAVPLESLSGASGGSGTTQPDGRFSIPIVVDRDESAEWSLVAGGMGYVSTSTVVARALLEAAPVEILVNRLFAVEVVLTDHFGRDVSMEASGPRLREDRSVFSGNGAVSPVEGMNLPLMLAGLARVRDVRSSEGWRRPIHFRSA